MSADPAIVPPSDGGAGAPARGDDGLCRESQRHETLRDDAGPHDPRRHDPRRHDPLRHDTLRDDGVRDDFLRDDDQHPRRLSALIAAMAAEQDGERLTLDDIALRLGNRAFAAIMFVFGFLNAIPTGLPGVSSVLGAPLIFVTFQLMTGRQRLWLPPAIGTRSLSRADFRAFARRAGPWIVRAEDLLRPRLLPLTGAGGRMAIGLVAFLLSVLIFLPVPFGNAPPGAAVAIFALALFERDGVAAILGYIAAVISACIVSGVVFGLVKAALLFIRYLFS